MSIEMQNPSIRNDAESLMRLGSLRPIPALRPFVDHFAIREASLGLKQIYHPLAARHDCFLEFYLEDPFRVVNLASGAIHRAPRLVLVGPQASRREDIIHTGTLKVFHIGFTPTGFNSLFQIPARLIANVAESAEAVLGTAISELEQRLASSSVDLWPATAEEFLLRRMISSNATGRDVAAGVASSLLIHRGTLPVSELAKRQGKSVRQIERLFEDRVGLTPKLFSRIARLQTALKLQQRKPLLEWSAIALEAGYFDQSHMVREFRALTGETPGGFKRLQRELPPTASTGTTSHLSYRRHR